MNWQIGRIAERVARSEVLSAWRSASVQHVHGSRTYHDQVNLIVTAFSLLGWRKKP